MLHYSTAHRCTFQPPSTIERIQHKNLNNNEVIFGVDRRYDKLGNVTVERRDHEAGKGSVFRYDNAYRLTSSYFSVDLTGTGLTTYADPSATPTTFGFKRSFNLDTRGNRTGSSGVSEVTDGGATLHNTNYVVTDPANGNGSNMNLYGSVDGLSYTYDATEQMTYDPSTGLNYEYDYKGQIVRKYGTGGTFATYKYDCQGRLVVQTDDQIFAAQAEDRAAETVTINDIPAGCSCSGGGGDSKLGEENFTNDPFDPNPTLYHPIVSRAFYCPVLGAHGSGSSGAVHPLTAASPSSAPGQGSTFPGFQSLICYEGLHDRFLLEDQLGSIIGELDEQCRRKHEYVYLDYGQPISRPIVFDSAGYSPAVSGPNSFGETTISVSGLPGIDLEGMEVRVSDGTGNYASATIMIRSGSSLVVWDTASPTVASLISSTRSFVIHSCATSWLDGTWEAVDTGTSKLTENDRDLTTINGQGDLTGYKLIANSGNGTVFTVTGHDPADPAHKIFVTPSISGIVAAGDHYHLQKWEPVGGPPVIATQSGYFTAISGGANTTFTVFASAAGGAISNFRPWQVGYYLQPNTKKPSYHKILSVTGNTVTVEGNCAALASIGPANHFRVVAPPCVNGYEGGRVYDPVCEESRYLWAGYRYEWPIVGHRLLNTQQPDYNQPGPDGSASTWDGNALGQYHCWNREYDVLMGRWTTPDPAADPWWGLLDYCFDEPLSNDDPDGLSLSIVPGKNWAPKRTQNFRKIVLNAIWRICPDPQAKLDVATGIHVPNMMFCRRRYSAKGHAKGCALVACLVNSKFSFRITNPGSQPRFVPDDWDAAIMKLKGESIKNNPGKWIKNPDGTKRQADPQSQADYEDNPIGSGGEIHIGWAPGKRWESNGQQLVPSLARVLLHELGHACRGSKGGMKLGGKGSDGVWKKGGGWSNEEEFENVTTSENPIAREIADDPKTRTGIRGENASDPDEETGFEHTGHG